MKATNAKYPHGKTVNIPSTNPVLAYFRLAQWSWLLTLLGWLFVAVSMLLCWEVPSSGAVLIGCVIASEIIYERQRWRKVPTDTSGRVQLVATDDNDYPAMWGPVVVAPANSGKFGALISLSKDVEIHNVHGHQNPYWLIRETASRVDNRVTYFLAASALFGTVLWGYGHLIWSA